jgi:two-component system response regulator AtoC
VEKQTIMERVTKSRDFIADGWDLPPDDVIFGKSPAMEAVRLSVDAASSANIPILLLGPSGTGKDILARFIHRHSAWGDGAFIKVNCPAIPGTLLESELFGYQKGAFTGAYASKRGRVELADRGTLFLDEIADLEPGLQAKLLQLLQDGKFCRIGAHEEVQVEARVICATNRPLEKESKAGTFRADLFYRINAFLIELPVLQQRICDIAVLTDYFLERFGRQFKRAVCPVSRSFRKLLHEYSWPGNIRELENVIKRYVLVGQEEVIRKSLENGHDDDRSLRIPKNGVINLKDATRQVAKKFEHRVILQTLEDHRWNRRTTAHALSISYAALLYKLREAGIPPRRSGRRPELKSSANERMVHEHSEAT